MDDDQQSDDHGIFSELSGAAASANHSAQTAGNSNSPSADQSLAAAEANTEQQQQHVNLEDMLQDDQIGTIVTDADGNEVLVIGHMPQSTTPTAVLRSDANGSAGGGGADHSAGEDGEQSERILHELESPKAAAAAAAAARKQSDALGIEVEIDGSWQLVGGGGDGEANDEHTATIASITSKHSPTVAAGHTESGVDRARRQLQQLTNVIKSRPKKTNDKSPDKSPNGGSHQLAAASTSTSTATTSSAVASDHGAKVLNVEILKPAGTIPSNQLIKSMQNRLSQKIDQILVVAPSSVAPKQRTISAQSDYSASGIEIPKEFIVPVSLSAARADELHETDIVIEASGDHQLETTSFIISTADDLNDDGGGDEGGEELPDADLLAILEGNDYDCGDADDRKPTVGEQHSPVAAAAPLDKDSEMELALQQMMSLPQKRKGRPCKPKPEMPVAAARSASNRRTAASAAAAGQNDLVSTLVQDWSGGSDEEADDDDGEEDFKPPVQYAQTAAAKKAAAAARVAANSKAAVVVLAAETSPPATFKRSRIIKKKVIWDPDAPETAVSYASRVQSTGGAAVAAAKGAPRILNKIPASQQQDRSKTRTPPLLAKPRRQAGQAQQQQQQHAGSAAAQAAAQAQVQALQQRKRKVSEVDRLLRDEGAINMLNALKRESAERDELQAADEAAAAADENQAHNAAISPVQGRQGKSPAAAAAAAAAEPVGQRRTKRPHTPAQSTISPGAVKKEPASGVKRPRKATTAAQTAAAADSSANSWDYIYSHRSEDSLIIRRRSNSSYSSSTSTNRLSVDARETAAAAAEPAAAKVATPTAAVAGGKLRPGRPPKGGGSFEFAKPSARRSAAASDSNAEDATLVQDIRSKPSPANSPVAQPASSSTAETRRSKRGAPAVAEESAASPSELNQLNAKERKIVAKLNSTGVVATVVKSPTALASAANKGAAGATATAANAADYQEIELKRRGAVVQVVLQPFSGKLENVFTVQLMREVRKALHSLSTDTGCKVVLISSATATFCNGLDYTALQLNGTPEKRRTSAQTLATEVSQFIESLASFPKTLVAAVHGRCVGLGVTILPLFDVVLAKETATFETPFARAGQLPEASSVLQLSTKVAHNAKTELLLLGETLDAKEAQQAQLVTRVLGANGFEAEVQRRTTALAAHSAQALDSMKAVAQSAELTSLPIRMADEQKLLQQHWCSAEWQESFKRYLSTKQW